MKKILGLDLGTNSIGWAVVEIDHELKIVRIIAIGSRILPMDAGEMSKFESGGKLKSSASDRTSYRTIRKNKARFILRRDRLHCVLNLLEMLPEQYKLDVEWNTKNGKRSGKLIKGKEPKLAYYHDENGKEQFLFKKSYLEMEQEFRNVHPELFYKKKDGTETKIPYDWTLYYLRKKALTEPLTDEELAWVIMSFLPKRGYEKVMGQDEKEQKTGELSEIINAKVDSIEELEKKSVNGLNLYHIKLVDEYKNIVFEYDEEASCQITKKEDFKQIVKVSKLDEDGEIKSVEVSICEIKSFNIIDIENTHEKKEKKTVYKLKLSSGWYYEFSSPYEPKFKGTSIDYIVKCLYDRNGHLKRRDLRMPQKEDWELEKLKTETSIQDYNTKHNTVGVASYIYSAILKKPNQKIKAGLVTTVERNYYESELKAILDSQKKFHSYLKDEQKYKESLMLLYPNNETHRNALAKKDISALLSDDIIFYQRDLKPKKSMVANCKYEFRTYEKDGEMIKEPLKCISKSNPYYQEFRIWQFIKRLRIIQLESVDSNGDKLVNQDVSDKILTITAKESLFGFLNNRKEISQKSLLKTLKLSSDEYKWNYEEDHTEPCNETRYDFILRLKRIKGFDCEKFLDANAKVHEPNGNKRNPEFFIAGCKNEYLLWHFFYSVKKKEDRVKGLPKLIDKLLVNAGMENKWSGKVVETLNSISTYKNEYGTYSEKAIKKLLPFMRLGKYWNEDDVLNIKTSDTIKAKVLDKEKISGEITDLQGLWVSSACYIVYGRYSEVSNAQHWTQPRDIKKYLEEDFKHTSLNNPVVEKVLRETLMVVHDIWTTYGEVEETYINEKGEEIQNYKKFFDNINVEICTSLKKNNKAKKHDSKIIKENRLANERAIALLRELKAVYKHEDIRDYSPFQQEKVKILESGIIDSIRYDKDDTIYEWKDGKITEKAFTKKEIKELCKKEITDISHKDIERYRLWLDQRYVSPYTGVPIKMSDLLNREKYQIEHIFPQERITFNAMSNKVLCETIVNKAKGAMTGYEFILKCNGMATYKGENIKVLSPEKYVEHVKRFITDEKKQEILLSKNIPNKFGNNQLNNTRYIEKLAMGLLSNIVREDDEDEFKSKNVLVVSGGVTSILKHNWQLDDAWNEIIKPRFIRMNNLLDTNDFGEERLINGHRVFVPSIPDSEANKKRIDHRHHALDALIVALATNNHINYINNISALDINTDRKSERKDLKAKYMVTIKYEGEKDGQYFLPPMQFKENGNIVTYEYAFKEFESHSVFKDAAIEALQNTLVTFKQKNRIMRQRINWIQHPEYKEKRKEDDINLKKNYSVRQSLHKETYYGKRSIKPTPIEDAIETTGKIVEKRIKFLIQQYKQEGKNNDQIISEIRKTDPVVYVFEECATTKWSHSLDYLSTFVEKEGGQDKKKEKSGKSAIIREIETVADITIQNILKKHLSKYDSIKMSIPEAVNYYEDIVTDDQKELVKKYKEIGVGSDKIIDVYVGCKSTEGRQIVHNPQIAFSADGIKSLNANIFELNNKREHKPIYKVQMIQALGKMFPVSEKKEDGQFENIKNKQYVISNAGSNNFCGFYKSKIGQTKTIVPTLRETIYAIRKSEDLFPKTIMEKDDTYELKFLLSPLDLVYMPTEDEIINECVSEDIDFSRVFVVNDFNDGGVVYFRPYNFATAITDKEVDLRINEKGNLIGSFSDKTASFEGKSIRDYCIPLKVDRLGNITAINGKKL